MLKIWFVALAAAAGVREGFHIRIVAFEEALPRKAQVWLRVLANVVVGLCGVAMAVWGSELVLRTWSHTIPSLGLPRGLAYGGLPLGGALIALFSLERIAEELAGERPQDEEDPRWS
jgi:TRAP-type C4-dicarboxylate transport system permease small subunit